MSTPLKAGERPQPHWGLQDWLQYQEQLHPRGIELGLTRVRHVAQRLGLLEQPPLTLTLTIGGTNGKGSSATLAALICREAGHRVGLYTSPHLLHYQERVQVDGQPVTAADLCEAFAAIEAARGTESLTYFEFGTLAALWLFRRERVDVQVLEVGLGGRLDAVNLLDADGALVTSIGLDHQDWLGPDRESIGREKAGIYRATGVSVCADPQPPATLAAAGWQLGRDFHFGDEPGGSWCWSGGARQLQGLPLPGLPGRFQLQNAAGVLALVLALPKLRIEPQHIARALPRLSLPGRFQRVGRVILDVAHNAEAAEALVQTVTDLGLAGRLQLVLGMLSDKPVEAVGAQLARIATEAHIGSLPGPRGLSAQHLAARLAGTGLRLHAHDSIAQAYDAAQAQAQDGILVTGSFLTVADVAARL